MNTPRLAAALLTGHVVVASVAWICGWCAGRLSERRYHELADWRTPVPCYELIDLADPPNAYDWQRDGECVKAH
jgi:hypothetical protein